MDPIYFKITFALLFVVYVLIRVPFEKSYRKAKKIISVQSSIEKALLFIMALGLFLIPLIWLLTPFIDFLNLNFPDWLRIIGIAIAMASLFYFQWIHKSLGENWTPTLEIRAGHKIIKTGPYRMIRHPMYFQIWLWTIAQILIVSNLLAGFSGIVAFSVLYFIRVPSEERMLIDYFGDEYIEYMKCTGRIFPKLYRAK